MQADQLLAEADAALDNRDLGEYQAKVEEAKVLIDQALELMVPRRGAERQRARLRSLARRARSSRKAIW